jgi:hypothetical protein
MVDVALTQAIVKRLNRWYRKRSRPHGTIDHTYRGVRLAYNNSYRLIVCLMSAFLLFPAGALYFWPDLFADKPRPFVIALKIGWAGLLVVVFLAPLQALREFLVVNDEGILKSNVLGKQIRLEWKEIAQVRIDSDGNDVTFLTGAGNKLKASLAYNGWQDFLEISAKHLDSALQSQLAFALSNQRLRASDLKATG